MRIAGKHATSLVDGKGINYVLFVQGCNNGCKECHNPSTWDVNGGVEMSLDEIKKDIMSYVPPVSGVTFSGGEPSMQMGEVIQLATYAKSKNLKTTLYTGHQISELDLPKNAPFDTVIDGRFVCERRSYDCAFRGSSNQRIWRKTEDGYRQIEIDDEGKEYFV